MRSHVTARQYHWAPIKKREALFRLRKNRQQPSVKRTQFPLTLSWACTVHKVQGLSSTDGAVSFDLESQKYLIGKYNKAPLKVNESAKREHERLRIEHRFKSQTRNGVTEPAITISLLNTRSFKTQLIEQHLLGNDILCLNEIPLEINLETKECCVVASCQRTLFP